MPWIRNEDLTLSQRLALAGAECLEMYKKAEEYGVMEFLVHPFKYADTLIRIGYEPFPPIERKTFFALYNPHLVLPGTIPYTRYIFFADGIGTFRCFLPCFLRKHVTSKVEKHFQTVNPFKETNREIANGPQLYERFTSSNVQAFVKQTSWDLLTKMAVTVATHPLHVITVRCFAQLVEDEEHYRSPVMCVLEILKSDGVKGFFAGLAPRLIGDLVYISTTAAIYMSCMQTLQYYQLRMDPDNVEFVLKSCPFFINIIVSPYSQQFYNVSDMMIVNGSSLALGNPPYMPVFTWWFDCWGTLRSDKLFKTSSGYFSRNYTGPKKFTEEGELTATGDTFGPTYFPPQGQSVPYLLRDYYAPLTAVSIQPPNSEANAQADLIKKKNEEHKNQLINNLHTFRSF